VTVITCSTRKVKYHGKRGFVGPVKILEDNERLRIELGKQSAYLGGNRPSCESMTIRVVTFAQKMSLKRPNISSCTFACTFSDRLEQIDDQCVRARLGDLLRSTPQHHPATLGCFGCELADEAGLSDPGLAGDDRDAASSVQQRAKSGELLLAADEHRARIHGYRLRRWPASRPKAKQLEAETPITEPASPCGTSPLR
jgi:hypothetical protein